MNRVISVIIFTFTLSVVQAQLTNVKDSVVYRFSYRDTIVYRYKYDTIRIAHYIHSDTLWTPNVKTVVSQKKHTINQNNWGIGPSLGAYYSPFNGFDVSIGFGVQYYFLAIPSFRNPHLGHKRKR
jgi:hypothetical protein